MGISRLDEKIESAAEKKTRFSGLKRRSPAESIHAWLAAEKKTRFSGLKRRSPAESIHAWLAAEKKTRFSGLKRGLS